MNLFFCVFLRSEEVFLDRKCSKVSPKDSFESLVQSVCSKVPFKTLENRRLQWPSMWFALYAASHNGQSQRERLSVAQSASFLKSARKADHHTPF